LRKDGSRFWAHVVIDAIRNDAGELIGFAKITRDITERKNAEQELEEAVMSCGRCGSSSVSQRRPSCSRRSVAGPFTPSGFAKLLARAGEATGMGFKVHPHMLRHACGYALANKGIDTRTLQAYLGHRSMNSTTRYAALAPGRFKNI
jgi:integrase